MSKNAPGAGSGEEWETAGFGNCRENTAIVNTSPLASMWLQVDPWSSPPSPHGLGCGDLESQVEGAELLADFVDFPPGQLESLSQPVHSFLLRQNAPQQQSSIWIACAGTIDKARRNAKALIFVQYNI